MIMTMSMMTRTIIMDVESLLALFRAGAGGVIGNSRPGGKDRKGGHAWAFGPANSEGL